MIRYIHCSRTISDKLSQLQRSGGKGELAVEQFRFLLDAFRRNDMQDLGVYCKRTKNGEKRMENCVKYDLGHGYRLVTVLKENHLFIPFLGSHDETSIWIDRHKHDIFSENSQSYKCERVAISHTTDDPDEEEMSGQNHERDIYEEHLNALLDESTLKEIFSGLYRQAR